MRSFLRGFGWSESVADRLFTLLDEEGTGEVDYNGFMAHFDSVLGPANRPAPRTRTFAIADPLIERDINQVAAILGDKLSTKFRSAREALSTLNLSNEGQVTRGEMRSFFRTMNMPFDTADRIFRALEQDCLGKVQFDDFVALFCQADNNKGCWWRSMEGLTDVTRPVMSHVI